MFDSRFRCSQSNLRLVHQGEPIRFCRNPTNQSNQNAFLGLQSHSLSLPFIGSFVGTISNLEAYTFKLLLQQTKLIWSFVSIATKWRFVCKVRISYWTLQICTETGIEPGNNDFQVLKDILSVFSLLDLEKPLFKFVLH